MGFVWVGMERCQVRISQGASAGDPGRSVYSDPLRLGDLLARSITGGSNYHDGGLDMSQRLANRWGPHVSVAETMWWYTGSRGCGVLWPGIGSNTGNLAGSSLQLPRRNGSL